MLYPQNGGVVATTSSVTSLYPPMYTPHPNRGGKGKCSGAMSWHDGPRTVDGSCGNSAVSSCCFALRRQHECSWRSSGLTEIAGLDNDGRIWAFDCNQLKITIERFYQLTGTYNSFESVLCLKTYEIHIYKQKLWTSNDYYLASCFLMFGFWLRVDLLD